MEENSPTTSQYSIKVTQSEPENLVASKSKTQAFFFKQDVDMENPDQFIQAKKAMRVKDISSDKLFNASSFSKTMRHTLNKDTFGKDSLKYPKTSHKLQTVSIKAFKFEKADLDGDDLIAEKGHLASDFKLEKQKADALIIKGIKEEKDFDEIFNDPLVKKVFNLKE